MYAIDCCSSVGHCQNMAVVSKIYYCVIPFCWIMDLYLSSPAQALQNKQSKPVPTVAKQGLKVLHETELDQSVSGTQEQETVMDIWRAAREGHMQTVLLCALKLDSECEDKVSSRLNFRS